MQSLGVMVPRLLLVRQVSVGLWQGQKPPDGAQVLPQSAVLWAGVLLPPKQLAQPTLERRPRQTWRRRWRLKTGGVKQMLELYIYFYCHDVAH